MQDIHEGAFTYTLRHITRNRDNTFLAWFSSTWFQRKLEARTTGLLKIPHEGAKSTDSNNKYKKQTNKSIKLY